MLLELGLQPVISVWQLSLQLGEVPLHPIAQPPVLVVVVLDVLESVLGLSETHGQVFVVLSPCLLVEVLHVFNLLIDLDLHFFEQPHSMVLLISNLGEPDHIGILLFSEYLLLVSALFGQVLESAQDLLVG